MKRPAVTYPPDRPKTPPEALNALIAGNQQWVTFTRMHPGEDALRRTCVLPPPDGNGQMPHGAIISCSDSRLPPELVFDQGKVSARALMSTALAYLARDGYRDAHDPLTLVNNLKNGELAIYFDCGQQDDYGFQDQALLFHDRLTELGIRHEFESIPGRHDEALWAKRIKYSLQFHADYFVKTGTHPPALPSEP